MKNQYQISHRLKQAMELIDEANALTHAENGSTVEPKWWLDMMDSRRKLLAALEVVDSRAKEPA